MTIATAAKVETHPPLAKDSAGNLRPIPDDTAAWSIFRETAGRPHKLRGPDKNPIRFPLQTTPEDLLELCGPGVYRVYPLDQLGEPLADEHTAKWDLTASSHRNVSMDSIGALRAAPTSAPAATDLRFALETMAQMMRTNSDALRLVAESQVDLAKTIATVKGLPRNAAMYLPTTAPAANDSSDPDDDDDEDDDDELESAGPTNYFDLLMPFSEALAGKVAEMVPGLFVGAASARSQPTQATSTAESPDADLASRPFEARELIDLQYAQRKGEAKRAAKQQAPAVNVPLQARVMKDPQLVRQLMALKSALAPEEIETLLSAAGKWEEADQTRFLDTIKPLPSNEAFAFCREVIDDIRRARNAATEA